MDLSIKGYHTLSQHEENIIKSGINIPFNKVSEYFAYKYYSGDWHHQAYKSYKRLHELKNIWSHLNRDQVVKESHYLYDCVYRCRYNSLWINNDLFIENGKYGKYTDDHPFSARMVMRIIMTDWPDFMNNLDEYTNVLHFITNTIGITAKENQDVKVLPDNKKGELKINVLTKDKYSHFKFRNKETNEIKIGLPFKIPDWFSEGEKKRLISDKEKNYKDLLKKKIPYLQDIAKSLDINIFKLNKNGDKNKNKTKPELIEEIINKNQNIIHDYSDHIVREEINNNNNNNDVQSDISIESTNQVDDNSLDEMITDLRNSSSSDNISIDISGN